MWPYSDSPRKSRNMTSFTWVGNRWRFLDIGFSFYSNFLGNHKIVDYSWAYIIHNSFLFIFVLLFHSPHISYHSMIKHISDILDQIKNVTVKHSSIIKSATIFIIRSLDEHGSFISCGDIPFLISNTAYNSCFITKVM